LERRWADKGQAMFLRHPDEKELKEITSEEFYDSLMKHVQPDRLRRVDTLNSKAIVGSANIKEIAETSRND
jgi:hypothetical protein